MGLEVAERIGGRIISLDSMQVYRGMDVGTAKPSSADRERVPHSMIDLADPSDEYTVQEFQREARSILESAPERVILVGGSGLHMRAVIDPLEFLPTDAELREELEGIGSDQLVAELVSVDPAAGDFVDLANPRRVIRAVEVHRLTGRSPQSISREPSRLAVTRYEARYPCRIVGLDPGEALADRVDARLAGMVAGGLIEEVAELAPRLGRTAAQAVGYAQMLPVIRGERSLDEGVAATRAATLDLARRQRAWFRRDPRVRWLDPLRDDVVAAVMELA